jgi:plasmid maintenance system antidote protein VapI
MSDASAPGENWSAYLRRMTKRPDWSVAKLARESGINRATIFKWIGGEEGLTVDSVLRVATALGDDPNTALRAAANIGAGPDELVDAEVDVIMRAPVDDELKQKMLQRLRDRRERDRQRRLEDFQEMLDDLAARKNEG